MATDKHC